MVDRYWLNLGFKLYGPLGKEIRTERNLVQTTMKKKFHLTEEVYTSLLLPSHEKILEYKFTWKILLILQSFFYSVSIPPFLEK